MMLFNTGKLRFIAIATTMLASVSFISTASAAAPTYALVQINQQALFFNLMNKGAQDAAKASGKDLVIFNSNEIPSRKMTRLKTIFSKVLRAFWLPLSTLTELCPR